MGWCLTYLIIVSLLGQIGVSAEDDQIACWDWHEEVARCVEVFMKRDLPVLKTFINTETHDTARLEPGERRAENICSRLREMQDCYRTIFRQCRKQITGVYIDVVQTLDTMVDWLCLRPNEVLGRLLWNLNCINRAWNLDQCKADQLPPYYILKILELEAEREVCPPLRNQFNCLMSQRYLRCENDASGLYNSTFSLFLQTWCSAPGTGPQFIVIILVALTSLTFLY